MADGIPLMQAMFAAPLIGFSQRWPRVLHAIEMDEIVRAWGERSTVTAACGAKRLKLIATDDLLACWPPNSRGLPEHRERCKECWEATGRKRPRTKITTPERAA